MEQELFKLAAGNGLWATLYVFLFIYFLYDSRNRENKYVEREVEYQRTISENQDIIKENQDIIKELSKKLGVVDGIQKDVSYIKVELERR